MSNSKIITDSDLDVSISRIQQWHTYDGLLEGLPTERMNNQILKQTMNGAKEFCGINEVHLIEPKLTPITHVGEYAFGNPIGLPKITCIAELSYFLTFKNSSKDFSALGLIWFQDDYAFPIDSEIIEKIKKIPFRKLCGEFNY